MRYGLTTNFGVGLARRGLETGSPAFRYGLPFRGDGSASRDAGPGAELPAQMVAGALIEVNWRPDVSWRKRIRFSNCE
jgi:hypothetical protein